VTHASLVDSFITRASAQCWLSRRFIIHLKAGYLSLALALELCLLLLPDFLVNLGSFAGLVAVCASGQGGILLAALLVEGHILALLLALLLALELVLDGALVLCLLLALCCQMRPCHWYEAKTRRQWTTYLSPGRDVSCPCPRGSGSPSSPPRVQSP
jgi:hypothetical protein